MTVGTDIRVILLIGIKFFAITYGLIHFMGTIIAWRQILGMDKQVTTPTGAILLILNFINIFFVLLVIVATFFLFGTTV